MNFLKNVTKDVVLDQTTYGAIQSARWGAQDRTFPDQYSSGAALGVETHCFGPWVQVSPSKPKESCPKGATPEPATGMAWGDAQEGVGTAGAMS